LFGVNYFFPLATIIFSVIPKSADRTGNYITWKKSGSKTAIDYAKERVEKILFEPTGSILEEKRTQEIERILTEARNYYKKAGLL